MPKARVVINVASPELKKLQEQAKKFTKLVEKNNQGSNYGSKGNIPSSRGGKYRRKTHKMRKSHKSHKSNKKTRKTHKRRKSTKRHGKGHK